MEAIKIGWRKWIFCVDTPNIEATNDIANSIKREFPKIKFVIIGNTI